MVVEYLCLKIMKIRSYVVSRLKCMSGSVMLSDMWLWVVLMLWLVFLSLGLICSSVFWMSCILYVSYMIVYVI